jgi:hypothetical protein
MFDYLQQFNKLPKDLRDKVSSAEAMASLADLEKKYQVDLAVVVMKVMIKSITVKSLPLYFAAEFNLNQANAESLAKELTEKIFIYVADYLDLSKEIKALDLDRDINLIIKEAGLVLPSSDLVGRLKSILSTYLKGIRSKLAARDALAKSTNLGGLSLTAAEIDRVFKVCEQKTFKSLEVNLAAVSKVQVSAVPLTPTVVVAPQSRLDKIISAADSPLGTEYNLKQAIASGQIKKPEVLTPKPEVPLIKPEVLNKPKESNKKSETLISKLDTNHEVPAPKKELDLPIHKEELNLPKPKIIAPVTPVAPVILKPIPPRPTPPPLKPIASSRPAFSTSISRPSMHDIKPMPRIMGPLEELQFLDLINFRRLGKTPEEITAKVFSKIKLLEADGYDKMVAGVKAWRQSPVNRLYLKMMQEAISRGLTIKDLAITAQKDNKNYLHWDEIEAILTMNSQLIF